jgi:hypothetical protein
MTEPNITEETDAKELAVVYESEDGEMLFEVNLQDETVWLNQKQMALLFDKGQQTISEHINNIYEEDEAQKESTYRKFRLVRKEGQRNVHREVDHYNLDIIISVGYRVNSQRGVQFRKWATTVLKNHLIQGYTKNLARLQEKKLELDVKSSDDTFTQIVKDWDVDNWNGDVNSISKESSRLISTSIGSATDTETLIIKTHLFCEKSLYTFLEQKVKNKKALKKANLKCSALSFIAKAYIGDTNNSLLWEAIGKLTSVRNIYAHELEPKNDVANKFFLELRDLLKSIGYTCDLSDRKSLLVLLSGLIFVTLSLDKENG